MKTFVLWCVLFVTATALHAQTPVHSTIQKLEASYRVGNNTTDITQVTQLIHIELNTEVVDVQKINVLVKDVQTGSVVYQVSYTGSTTQTGSEGQILFSRSGNVIDILNPTVISLRPFTYELSTESSSGQLSELFTDTQ